MIGVKYLSLVLKDFWGASYAGLRWIWETPQLEYALRVRGWILNFCSVRALTKANCGSVFRFHDEFKSKTGLHEHVLNSLKYFSNPFDSWAMSAPDPCYVSESELLYILNRIIKPDVIVETGVASGVSTTYILQALEDNGKGNLYSIDISPQIFGDTKPTGWIVPENLRERWRLVIGASSEKLQSLLEELGEINIFVHDSLHTYENMLWEYKTAWPYITKGGLLLSDDVQGNDAFKQFCRDVEHKGVSVGSFGGISK